MKLIFFSLPRSGSNWMGSVFSKRFKYFPEYFCHCNCPICFPNPNYQYRCSIREENHTNIKNLFGSKQHWHSLASLATESHKNCIEKTWTNSEYELNKETTSFSKIDAYQGFYDEAFCIYRNRFLTFPGGTQFTERCYEAIWKSLQHNKESYDKNVKDMLNVEIKSINDSLYAAHAIASYFLIKGCIENNIAIIKYEKIKTASFPNLFEFAELRQTINETFSARIRMGLKESEKVYEKISNYMEENIRDTIMKFNFI